MGSFPVLLAVCVILMALLFRLAVNRISKKIKT
jgi:hypothetical protein